MLFNSLSFLVFFLPLMLCGYHLAASRLGWRVALGWLVLGSLFFYAWWYPPYLVLIVVSMAANFIIGDCLRKTGSRLVLVLGIGLDLALIGMFKYAGFVLSAIAWFADAPPPSVSIVLPLAISFFTFQQIAFLVDCWRGDIDERDPLHFAFFVMFFPQLIAGPIVRHQEISPQIRTPRAGGLRANDLAIGFTLLAIGMIKKVLIADRLALYADPVFADAGAGIAPSLVEAWAGTMAFTFQLYFDFSGYCDMAIGLGRMFGFRLPENFDTPYRATSIISFWRRWHMTLGHFLREYLYRPLGGNRGGAWRLPALLSTMLLGGLWHGAGWTFVIWGGIHGVALAIAHGWRMFRHQSRRGYLPPGAFRVVLGWACTFAFVHFAWVLFRAEDFDAAMRIYAGLFGGNGARLPEYYLGLLEPIGGAGTLLQQAGITFEPLADFRFHGVEQLVVIGLAAAMAILGPKGVAFVRSMDVRSVDVRRMEPDGRRSSGFGLPQGLAAGIALGIAMTALYADPPMRFIYFQF